MFSILALSLLLVLATCGFIALKPESKCPKSYQILSIEHSFAYDFFSVLFPSELENIREGNI